MSTHVRFKSKLGALILAAREKHKLSQREVATLIGMRDEDQSVVSAWERGWRPIRVEDKTKSSLADLLSVKISDLDVLLRDDETARARALTRRKAGRAVRRQYEAPTPPATAPSKKDLPKPPVKEARPLESILKVREAINARDTVSMIVSAIAANDPALSGVDSDALVRLVRRFVAVQKTLAAL